MLEKPRNYEEAKKIITEAVHDDLHEHSLKVIKLRAGLVAALGIGAAVAAGIVTESPTLTATILPTVAIFDSPFIFQLLGHIKAVKNVESGKFLYHMSEEDAMKLATDYVDDYNAFEEKRGGMHR